jgi:hypothetical protein
MRTSGAIHLLCLLAALCLLAGCPSRSGQTDSPAAGGSSRSGNESAAPEVAAIAPAWPLSQVGLPAGAAVVKLPDSVAKGYADPGEASADGSALHQAFADPKMDYWYVGFSGGGSPEELKAYFDGCASQAGLIPDDGVNGHQAEGELFQLLYASAEGDTSMRVYQDPESPAAGEPVYIIFLQQI